MPIADLTLVLVLVPLIAASAVCSGSETALFGLGHVERARLARTSPGAAAAVAYLLSRPRPLLVSVLLLNTCVNTAYFVVAAVIGRQMRGPLSEAVFSIGAVIALILVGEVIPKVLAVRARVAIVRLLGRGMLAVYRVLTPARVALEVAAIAPLTRLIRPAAAEPAPVTPDELSALLEHGARGGALAEDEQRLLAEVVELGTTRVRDVMTPRVDMHWLDIDAAPADVLAAVRNTGRARFPVVQGSADDRILGWADLRRYLPRVDRPGAPGPRLADVLEPACFVPDRIRLDQLLEEFHRRGVHMALCVDEFGAVTGEVHIRDVVDELLAAAAQAGPGADERIQPLEGGRWRVPGRLAAKDWVELLGPARVPAQDRRAGTVAGLILQALGRVPSPGDAVRVGNVRLEVESMRGPVIERVIVSVEPGPGGAAGAESHS